jgi:hypothetical protein
VSGPSNEIPLIKSKLATYRFGSDASYILLREITPCDEEEETEKEEGEEKKKKRGKKKKKKK